MLVSNWSQRRGKLAFCDVWLINWCISNILQIFFSILLVVWTKKIFRTTNNPNFIFINYILFHQLGLSEYQRSSKCVQTDLDHITVCWMSTSQRADVKSEFLHWRSINLCSILFKTEALFVSSVDYFSMNRIKANRGGKKIGFQEVGLLTVSWGSPQNCLV